jgi:hypothetical protein
MQSKNKQSGSFAGLGIGGIIELNKCKEIRTRRTSDSLKLTGETQS